MVDTDEVADAVAVVVVALDIEARRCRRLAVEEHYYQQRVHHQRRQRTRCLPSGSGHVRLPPDMRSTLWAGEMPVLTDRDERLHLCQIQINLPSPLTTARSSRETLRRGVLTGC
jgi:hypothetical protein